MFETLMRRLRALVRRNDAERELDEEMSYHLERQVELNVAAGMSPAEARAAARRQFVGVDQSKEECRDARGVRPLEDLGHDLRFGARMLWKSPTFTAVAVAALALGIGANSAIFSVVNTVLLRPLPYKDPDRLVMVWEDASKHGYPRDTPAAANYVDWRDQNQVFESMAAMADLSFNLTGVGEPERIDGKRVSAGLFPLLGVEPMLGRAFAPEEDQPGRNKVVVMSHGLWQRRFGSDPAVVGRTLDLNGEGHTVVGVMPPRFQFPSPTDELWVPIAFTPQEAAARGNHYLQVVARLKPGVTVERAQAEMTTIAARLSQQYPQQNTDLGAAVVPLHEQVVGDIRPALLILLGAVGFVLLIACANVANLLLARAAVRQKEIATRVALGASRVRLVRQFLTESLLLSALGGALGLVLALWGVNLLRAFIPEKLAQVKAVSVDARVLGFTLLVSLLTGLVFGLVPALQASKVNLNETLKEGGRDTAAGSRGNRVRGMLVVAEVAVSLLLLIGAGLLINSFLRLRHVDPGFRADNLLTMQVALPRPKYPDRARRAAFYTEMLQRVEALPGVKSATVTNWVPLVRQGDSIGIFIEGQPEPQPGQENIVVTRMVSPRYFETMGMRLVRGRGLTPQDRADAPSVAVVSEAMARKHWPGEDAVGKRISSRRPQSQSDYITVVGVVNDVRQFKLEDDPRPQMYLSYEQGGAFPPRHLVVRTDVEPSSVASAVRGAVWSIDRDQPVSNVRTMEDVLSESVAQQRFGMLLLGVFAGVALLLAAVGLYGVMSYTVAQRSHEIGVRMALGAQTSDVLRLVVGQGLKLVSVGVLVGLVAAFALTRVMSGLLYGVSATDPATFAAISLALVGVALLASYVPARRATKVDPIIALRYE